MTTALMQKILSQHLDRLEGCSFPEQFTFVVLSSSVVERSAVNRLVVGSNPTSGAIAYEGG